jgi:biopolymer transport protein ExbD
MAFRKKEKKSVGAVSTASLPDIVFMLLFFFMVVTVMRETDPKVKIVLPQASELTRMEKKHLVNYINIGTPFEADKYGSEPLIQLDDAFAQPDEIPAWYAKVTEKVAEAEKGQLTTSLKVDEKTKMFIITQVKQELRQLQALRINYSTIRRERTQ